MTEVSTVSNKKRATLNMTTGSLWYAPWSFSIARLLGPSYSLRCVLFHDVSDTESDFTRGLGVTIKRATFESAIKFIIKHYTPVSLQDVVEGFSGRKAPSRPVLVTFDDAYASVTDFAVPLCSSLGVPSVFFINAVFLNTPHLVLDNLVCYVVNTLGISAVNTSIRAATASNEFEVGLMSEVFAQFLPSISFETRKRFHDALLQHAAASDAELATGARLYLGRTQLRALKSFNCEIGNHTYTHANCRSLTEDDFNEEIDCNRTALEAYSGTRVRAFSVPYGSSADLTGALVNHLQAEGY